MGGCGGNTTIRVIIGVYCSCSFKVVCEGVDMNSICGMNVIVLLFGLFYVDWYMKNMEINAQLRK